MLINQSHKLAPLALTLMLGSASLVATHAPLQAQTYTEEENSQIAAIYLQYYQLASSAEKLAARKNWRQAISKLVQAERILAGIVRDYPDWKVNLIEIRRNTLAQNLKEYRKQAKQETVGNTRDPHHTGYKPEVSTTQGGWKPISPQEANRPVEVLPGVIESSRQLHNELMRTKEELRRLAIAHKQLIEEHETASANLIAARKNHQIDKERFKELEANIETERKAGNKVVSALNQQLSELETRLAQSEKARIAAEERAQKAEDEQARLKLQLDELQTDYQRVVAERDALAAENLKLKQIIELNDPEKIKVLLDQNITLSAQLKDAQAKVEELSAQIGAHGDEQTILVRQLEKARGEIARLNEELNAIYDENLGYRKRISELTTRTHDLEKELEKRAATPTTDPIAKEELELLRSVIAKQKRTIQAQEEARKLLIDTYKQMNTDKPELVEAIDQLNEASSLDLTVSEQKLVGAVQKLIEASGLAEEQEKAAREKAIREGLEIETLADAAQKAFAAQRYTAAEQLYRTLVDGNPDLVPALVNLGTILLYRNKFEAAIDHLERATRLSPDLAVAHFLLGCAYYQIDDSPHASECFKRCLELDPANAEAFFYLANMEGIAGQHELALKHLAAAVKLKPELADAHYNMARIYIELGKLADAGRAYDRAMESGASPDPELENYLREHVKKDSLLGPDLVATVEPAKEAAQLNAGEKAAAVVADTESNTEEQGEKAKSFEQAHDALVVTIVAAPTPSPAGKEHETKAEYFSKTKVKKGKNTIGLRVKKSLFKQLRQRGGEMPTAPVDKEKG